MPYPKGDNSEDYILGTYLQDAIITENNNLQTSIPIEEVLW
jgi:hypothetical protein